MNKKRKYSRFLQTWSTNASNFRAKKILKSFGVSCDIYWQSYWSIFRYCYLSYWMFETNFWEVPSRFCIFGSVSERITWGEHPHQSMVLGHVHFKKYIFYLMFTEQEQYMLTKKIYNNFKPLLFLLSNDVETKEQLLKTRKPGAGAAARIFPFVPVDVTEVIILKSPAKPWLQTW